MAIVQEETERERKGVVTSGGAPLTLLGPALKVGDKAPDFRALGRDMKETGLKDFKGKIKIISVTPSLDTKVCDLQLRRFNAEAANFPGDVAVINISMDLPFAVDRFCTLAGIEKATALSDHRDASFGNAYGVLIKELRLLARSVFVIDKGDVIRHMQIVDDLSHHPDYDAALKAAKELAGP